ARIQDALLSSSDRQANAYELGRALAEMYWALDLAAPTRIPHGHDAQLNLNPVSWAFLFGDDRRSDISRLLARLAPEFAPLTPPAVAGSVEVWGQVAASEQWRSADGVRKYSWSRSGTGTRCWWPTLTQKPCSSRTQACGPGGSSPGHS